MDWKSVEEKIVQDDQNKWDRDSEEWEITEEAEIQPLNEI
jgi:hypothetical protein